MYKSDVRSMINYIQICNQNKSNTKKYDILNDSIFVELIEIIKTKPSDQIEIFIYSMTRKYNIEKNDLIKRFFNYLIFHLKIVNSELLLNMEKIIHCDAMNDNSLLWHYFFDYLKTKL